MLAPKLVLVSNNIFQPNKSSSKKSVSFILYTFVYVFKRRSARVKKKLLLWKLIKVPKTRGVDPFWIQSAILGPLAVILQFTGGEWDILVSLFSQFKLRWVGGLMVVAWWISILSQPCLAWVVAGTELGNISKNCFYCKDPPDFTEWISLTR